jgi:hypothetical protein
MILGNLAYSDECKFVNNINNSDLDYFYCDNANYSNKDKACIKEHTSLIHFVLVSCDNSPDEATLVTTTYRNYYEKYNTIVKLKYDGIGDIKLLSDVKAVFAIMTGDELKVYGREYIQDEVIIKRDELKVGDILELKFTHNYQPIIYGLKGFIISFCGEIAGEVSYFCRAYTLNFD